MNSRTFVSLVAVSTERQAEDKASLKDQSKNSRNFGESMGWEFVKEFSIEGYSRSGYYDLSKAFIDIPALGRLAREIQSGVASMIIVDSFDRLGSLGLALYEWLKPYRVQLRSVQQPTPLFDPTEYEWHKDNGTYKMIVMSLLDQDYRIAKLIRAWDIGTKKRVEGGYYAKRVPFGYIKLDRYNVQLVPHIAGLLANFPAWYLGGMSTREIAIKANESGVPSRYGKTWTQSVVINILQSPFYAGKVYVARGRVDKATGKYVPLKNPELIDGKHEALWTYDTHLKIMDEFERRRNNRQFKRVYNFTSVLKCSECGQSLLVSYDNRKYKKTNKRRMYWRCPLAHVHLKKDYAEQEVIKGLSRLFASDAPLSSPDSLGATDFTDRELSTLRRQMTRLEQAYESGAYSVEEFTEKRKAYKAREAELLDTERQKEAAKRRDAERAEVVLKMRDLIPVLPRWLTESPPEEVRYHLLRVVRVTCYPDKRVSVDLV